MHDYTPQVENATCLSFRAGQVIHVLNYDNSGWWDGELDGRRGWFPSNYVTSEVGLLTEEELPRGKVSIIDSVSSVRSPWEMHDGSAAHRTVVDLALPACLLDRRAARSAV